MTATTGRSLERWTLVLAGAASFMTALDTVVVSTALDTIRQDLSASVADLEWTVNSYNLAFAVLLLPAAALGDRFGRRRMFALGLALFAAASAACAMSPSVGALIAARAVQGVGAALVTTLALALVSVAYPAARRGGAIGVVGAITGLGVACGPLVGGAITEGLDWQWIFWLNVPVGLLAIPFVLAKLKEGHGPDISLDLVGLVLITAGAFGVVWALVRGNQAGWDSLEVLGSGLAGISGIVGFAVWESRVRQPMLPMRFFRSKAFSAGNAAAFFMLAALFTAVFFFAQFLQVALGFGPLEAGLRLLPWTGTLFLCAPVAGALAGRFGERPFMVGGLTLQAAGLAWIALIARPDLPYADMVAPLVIAGMGVSMTLPSVQTAVVGAVDHAEIGKAAGANTMMRELGGVFGIALAVAAFAGAGSYVSAEAFVDGFTAAIGVGAGLSLAGAVVSLWVPPMRREVPDSDHGPLVSVAANRATDAEF